MCRTAQASTRRIRQLPRIPARHRTGVTRLEFAPQSTRYACGQVRSCEIESDLVFTVAELCADAVQKLSDGHAPVSDASLHVWPRRPGLYAVYASAEVWRTLALGDPPDGRPLYVGKAERSLSSRDIGTHFGYVAGGGNSITGSSTFRRSLSALLRTPLGFHGRYRNPANPKRSANFGLSRDHDAVLSDWMRNNLQATYWEMTTGQIPLADVETAVLGQLKPPLNIQKVQHQWTKQVKQARSVMAADCSESF